MPYNQLSNAENASQALVVKKLLAGTDDRIAGSTFVFPIEPILRKKF